MGNVSAAAGAVYLTVVLNDVAQDVRIVEPCTFEVIQASVKSWYPAITVTEFGIKNGQYDLIAGCRLGAGHYTVRAKHGT